MQDPTLSSFSKNMTDADLNGSEKNEPAGISDSAVDAPEKDAGSSSSPLPKIRVVLVEPLYQGNVGSVCRVMKNFGFCELFLVNPCALEGEARAMSSHAIDVLQNAQLCATVEEAVLGCDVVIGTTGSRAFKKCDHIRTPAYSPQALKERMNTYHPDTKFAVLFGREDTGFTNEELSYCSMIATVPTSHIYPVMNLSHAVGLMMYELSGAKMTGEVKTVDWNSFEALCGHFEDMLKDIEFTPHKQDKMALMMRRIFGRADLTPCEAQTLRGIFRVVQYHAKKGKGEYVGKLKLDIENQFEKEELTFFYENEMEE
ncbi:tRNA (cytidine(34)-2'-O)-methyltransferase [Methanosarcinaceae archaeon Ag5]|uniref:tRNA (Cytidine(34)-2'-O)-methyltransferase n=1 Tax=Methanolapillus africanus TaxID=3028297 RepID=A0AAE4ML95_9EURY|nr:tRNA (cytidine(34)-2'-O)-methyltransferase [Methanosarcinaceae archaeon Ag5]